MIKRKTWVERILEIIETPNGPDGELSWWSCKRVAIALQRQQRIIKTGEVSVYFNYMVKKGYVEKTRMPDHLCPKPKGFGFTNFYRRTKKPYKRRLRFHNLSPQVSEIAETNFRLYHDYPDYPKWFRDIMG